MTASEKYVSDLCRRSFFPFWSFLSPKGKKGKELCDILIVCNKIIVIISIKDVSVARQHGDELQYKRWMDRAVMSSVNQIYGAERYLKTTDHVLLSDGKTHVSLPPSQDRQVYRIAIAFGSRPEFLIPTFDFGKGFVHVFNESSTHTIISELDTIRDFINYLDRKEKFVGGRTVMLSAEVDLLALYLENNLEFSDMANVVTVTDGLWEHYVKSDEYKRWKEMIADSFIWDIMIHEVHRNHVSESVSQERRHEIEQSVRLINLEPRLNRVELGLCLWHAVQNKVSARMLQPLPGSSHCYVLVPLTPKNWARKDNELRLRCMVARLLNPTAPTVIGIAIGSNSDGQSCFDIFYAHIPELTDEFIQITEDVQREFGYFQKPVKSQSKDFR